MLIPKHEQYSTYNPVSKPLMSKKKTVSLQMFAIRNVYGKQEGKVTVHMRMQ